MAVWVPSFLDGTRRWMDNPSRLFLLARNENA